MAVTASRRKVALILSVLLAVLVLSTLLYARGGGHLPGWLAWLAPDVPALEDSGAQEGTLRSLRLAGFERASVGSEDGTVVVRVELPDPGAPADVGLAWQTAVAIAAQTYPEARLYVAQLFWNGTALLEVRVQGDDARSSVQADDAAALEAEAVFVYLARGEES